MKLKNIKFLSLLLLISNLMISALAIDISEFGDFASRSILMNVKENNLTHEQKEMLIARKLTPNAQCLIQQIEKGNIENVELILNAGFNPNTSYMADYPIYIAARENNFEIVKMLYEKGAKLDKGFNSELYVALKNKNQEMAQYLLDRKANIRYIEAINQNTILYMALKNNMLDIAKQLIDKGAPPDRKSVLYMKKKKLFYLIEGKI